LSSVTGATVPLGDAIATWIAAGAIVAPAFVSATTVATGFGLDGVATAGLEAVVVEDDDDSSLLLLLLLEVLLLLLPEVVLLAANAVTDMDIVSTSDNTVAMNLFFIFVSSLFFLYIKLLYISSLRTRAIKGNMS